jgi:hypothetical protein
MRIAAPGVVALALAAGCGGDEPAPDPADAVRGAAAAYIDALRGERWADACGRMTAAGRAAVAEGADGAATCAAALAAGGALPRETLDTVTRQLAGAPVRISGRTARLGPVGDLPYLLRFERRAGRWLVAR